MILTFQLGGEMVLVKIMGHNVLFSSSETNFQTYAPIEGLQLKRDGILKEHPDLERLPDIEMRQEAIKRFKEHIKKLDDENRIKDYVINELTRTGYELKAIQREGWRPVKVG